MNWRVPRLWDGETGYIIGGGPSTTQDMLDALPRDRVIATNKIYEVYPHPAFHIFADASFWSGYGREMLNKKRSGEISGEIVTFRNILTPCMKTAIESGKIKRVQPRERYKLETDPGFIAGSHTIMAYGLNFAAHLGCKRIVILGVDLKYGAKPHLHSGYPGKKANNNHFLKMPFAMESLKPGLEVLGVEVIDATPNGGLHVFDKRDFWQVMEETRAVAQGFYP